MFTYDSASQEPPFFREAKELWRYKDLLRNLVSRDLKIRYKRSALGFGWAMLNPLLTMIVLTLVFSAIFRFDVEDYAIFVLAGLLLWNFYSQGTNVAISSILNNSSVLTRIHVPASAFVMVAVGTAFVNLLYSLGPLLLIALVTGIRPSISWLFLVVPILQTAIFALGVGLLLAPLAVYFHDIIDIYQVLLSLYFYVSPIIYPADVLPSTLLTLQQFNPFFYLLSNIRTPLIDGTLPDGRSIILGFVIPCLILLIGWLVFTRMDRELTYQL
jgi:ABC-type polysaccharide/polyol phosphate export permease